MDDIMRARRQANGVKIADSAAIARWATTNGAKLAYHTEIRDYTAAEASGDKCESSKTKLGNGEWRVCIVQAAFVRGTGRNKKLVCNIVCTTQKKEPSDIWFP